MDATAQAELVRSGAVRAEELVTIALERAEAQASLGATTVLLPDYAMERAARATGPFAGVPILLKDAGQELEGTPHWIGTKALQSIDYHSVETTAFTRELEALGFIIIGKAAVPELMTGVTTEPPTGPPTRNPWDDRLTAGGSSGGSAAAVAARIVALSHGSDSTGSLRYPASCCGLFTLRPTTGRVPSRLPAGIADPIGLHVDFVLTRSVRDLEGVLGALSPRTRSAGPELRRIGMLDNIPFGLPIDQEVQDALTQTAETLADTQEIVALDPTFLEEYAAVLGAEVSVLTDAHRAAAVQWIEAQLGRSATTDDLSAEIIEGAERGHRLDHDELQLSRQRVIDAAARAAKWTDLADALLMPTLTVRPWPVGEPHPDGSLSGLFCSLSNFTGQPATVIPTVQRGIPVGVQLQGPHGSDEQLLEIVGRVVATSPTPS